MNRKSLTVCGISPLPVFGRTSLWPYSSSSSKIQYDLLCCLDPRKTTGLGKGPCIEMSLGREEERGEGGWSGESCWK